jgi:catechol 2,3-dioxygenase-like lactoylglutathione lyase family enzyme
MIDHISIGVRSAEDSKSFYDAALAPLGYRCLSAGEGSLGYGADEPSLWIQTAKHPVPADPESGLHICFAAPSRSAVDGFHREGLEAGGADNGAPGIRADYGPNYYAAFVIDPDGYRLEAYCSSE